jgi:hypothetical protein
MIFDLFSVIMVMKMFYATNYPNRGWRVKRDINLDSK